MTDPLPPQPEPGELPQQTLPRKPLTLKSAEGEAASQPRKEGKHAMTTVQNTAPTRRPIPNLSNVAGAYRVSYRLATRELEELRKQLVAREEAALDAARKEQKS